MDSTPDIFRPLYHFTPPHMWMNDPNGLVYHAGEYHLFYQYHPESTVWGPMHWGHAISRDLINWQHMPIALFPDENGMCFSGSAVVDENNTAGFGRNAILLVFTNHQDHNESQSLAYSTDMGRTWTKYSGNPVIPHPIPPSDFRDPKVFRYEDHWVMLLAAGNAIRFYVSFDLIHWEPSGSFGNGYGSTFGVWETPDLFQLPIENETGQRWVLTVGVGDGAPAGGSGTQYFIGSFDGRTFVSENSKETVLWADYGADYYAPQSWNNEPHGRRLMIAWMSNWQYARQLPTGNWRGAFGIIHTIALARTAQGIRLARNPIPELQKLRGQNFHQETQIIHPGRNLLEGLAGNSLEICAEFTVTNETDSFGFRVCVGAEQSTEIRCDVKGKKISIDRTRSGLTDFHEAFAKIHSANFTPVDGKVRLHILLDASSVEVFVNGGLVNFTECIFPGQESRGLELFTEGGSVILNALDIYEINPAGFHPARA